MHLLSKNGNKTISTLTTLPATLTLLLVAACSAAGDQPNPTESAPVAEVERLNTEVANLRQERATPSLSVTL